MSYDEFKVFVRDLIQREDLTNHGLLPVPTLRRAVGSRIARAETDAFLLRMHAEGLVHLLSHVEFDRLPAAVRREAVCTPDGQPFYWIRLP
ncbi:MAG: hypothetical protein DMF80_20525 [Acidobacteria bacterium]|nr:MAG: hypothetical protein DMF80_20525 [Acidobacteriota bacterium]PYQ24117.1 MAG: hypothetical protein DMF81_06590 [Acidobacteriota bacterium]